jgi:hypothetical protein
MVISDNLLSSNGLCSHVKWSLHLGEIKELSYGMTMSVTCMFYGPVVREVITAM